MKADSALILAGGRSTRMGYDKKQLALEGANLMESLIARLGDLFKEVLVSSNDPFVHENVTTLRDDIGAGPLAGIYQGLKFCQSDYLYVTACDMPFISADYIRYIREIVSRREVDACVARREDGFYEPFNAFFSKRCIEPMYEALIRHDYKISILLERLNLSIVDSSIVAQYNKGDMFFNINNTEDLERAKTKTHYNTIERLTSTGKTPKSRSNDESTV